VASDKFVRAQHLVSYIALNALWHLVRRAL